MESRDLQELRGDVHDLTDTIGGLGIELEALNTSVRALTAHLTGEDPLKDSLYFGDEQGGDRDLQPPPWVNAAPRACYELGQKSHRNADFTVGLVPSRSQFPAFLSRF